MKLNCSIHTSTPSTSNSNRAIRRLGSLALLLVAQLALTVAPARASAALPSASGGIGAGGSQTQELELKAIPFERFALFARTDAKSPRIWVGGGQCDALGVARIEVPLS